MSRPQQILPLYSVNKLNSNVVLISEEPIIPLYKFSYNQMKFIFRLHFMMFSFYYIFHYLEVSIERSDRTYIHPELLCYHDKSFKTEVCIYSHGRDYNESAWVKEILQIKDTRGRTTRLDGPMVFVEAKLNRIRMWTYTIQDEWMVMIKVTGCNNGACFKFTSYLKQAPFRQPVNFFFWIEKRF